MKIFRRLSGYLHYHFDRFRFNQTLVKIERFTLDEELSHINVFYRIGRNRLINELPIEVFSLRYINNISEYDNHRLTKFSTIQNILDALFKQGQCSKSDFHYFIDKEVKREQLF